MDLASETRSIYKLDPSQDNGFDNFTKPRSNQGPNNYESIMKNMNVADKSQILEKIHNMRMRVIDKRGTQEPSKPHLPSMSGNEKDKIMAQYYSAKR